MRNSWESHNKSDSEIGILGDADLSLAKKLINAGPSHAKFLRQLPVIFDLEAPNYFWREFDTYHIGVTMNSTSQMHTLGKVPFNADMFDLDPEYYTPERTERLLSFLNEARDTWIADGKKKGPEQRSWRAMVQSIPDSWLYRRTVSLNYQVLATMIEQRQNHRLSEWRFFCLYVRENTLYGEHLLP
jgi:hypothetical protein